MRARNDDCQSGAPTCQTPAMNYSTSGNYHYCHSTTDPTSSYENCADQQTDPGWINTWQFVVGSSCISSNELKACYGTVSGAMTCTNATGSFSYTKFDASSTNASVGIGDKYNPGPDTIFKDVRYHYNICLDSSQLTTIKADFTCKQFCLICDDPDTCNTCIEGWQLVNNECEACADKWATCSSSLSACSSCISGYYLQPAPSTGTCAFQCPSGYSTDSGANTCVADNDPC